MQNRSHHLPHCRYFIWIETERFKGCRGRLEVRLFTEWLLAAVFGVLIIGDISAQTILAQFIFRASSQQLQKKNTVIIVIQIEV